MKIIIKKVRITHQVLRCNKVPFLKDKFVRVLTPNEDNTLQLLGGNSQLTGEHLHYLENKITLYCRDNKQTLEL